MRLLERKLDGELAFHEFTDKDIPDYAILSHTWATGISEEVSFQDVKTGTGESKAGYKKISFCADKAKADGLRYFWLDTCCIDKTSSSELGEAINSMYKWYTHASVCYAYLEDVLDEGDLKSARWFTRGWTLQELIAPSTVLFFSRDWKCIGTKTNLASQLSEITGVAQDFLTNTKSLYDASIAGRMCWASKRTTTRLEDQAYCLLGIFDVHMPLLYGEGEHAFVRLQEEIMKQSADQSLFAWSSDDGSGCFAQSPSSFQAAGDIMPTSTNIKPYTMTNKGLFIQIPLSRVYRNSTDYVGILDCHQWRGETRMLFGIPLKLLDQHQSLFLRPPGRLETIPSELLHTSTVKDIFIAKSGHALIPPYRSLKIRNWASIGLKNESVEGFILDKSGFRSIRQDARKLNRTVTLPRTAKQHGLWRYAEVIRLNCKDYAVLVEVSTEDLFSTALEVWPMVSCGSDAQQHELRELLESLTFSPNTQSTNHYVRNGSTTICAVFLDRQRDDLVLRIHTGTVIQWLSLLSEDMALVALEFADFEVEISRFSYLHRLNLSYRLVIMMVLLLAFDGIHWVLQRLMYEFRRSRVTGDTPWWRFIHTIFEAIVFGTLFLFLRHNLWLAFTLGLISMPLASFILNTGIAIWVIR